MSRPSNPGAPLGAPLQDPYAQPTGLPPETGLERFLKAVFRHLKGNWYLYLALIYIPVGHVFHWMDWRTSLTLFVTLLIGVKLFRSRKADEDILAFMRRKWRHVTALVAAPLVVPMMISFYMLVLFADWERILNPPKIYMLCPENLGQFQDWNPCKDENENARNFIRGAADVSGLKADQMALFDSSVDESEEPYTLISFENSEPGQNTLDFEQLARTNGNTELADVIKKYKEEWLKKTGTVPPGKPANRLRIYFISSEGSKAEEETKDPVKQPPSTSNPLRDKTVRVANRNIVVYTVERPSQITLGLLIAGFYQAQGKTLSDEEIKKLLEEYPAPIAPPVPTESTPLDGPG